MWWMESTQEHDLTLRCLWFLEWEDDWEVALKVEICFSCLRLMYWVYENGRDVCLLLAGIGVAYKGHTY